MFKEELSYIKIFLKNNHQKFLILQKLTLLFFIALNHCATLVQKEVHPQEVKFLAVGDVMVHSTQLVSAYDKTCDCYNFHPVFEKVKSYIEVADFKIANLETTLPGDKKKYAGYPNFGSPDSLAEALKDSGFNIITTSNNHCLDTGKNGMRRTIDILQSLNLQQVGTYKDAEDYKKRRILNFEKNGIRFAMLAYTYSTNGILIPKDVVINLIDKNKISEDIWLAKASGVDFILVYYHFGPEYVRLPDKSQVELVEFTFQEGADIVLGGHPHVIQPYELRYVKDKYGEYKQRLVIYSLGNFVSSQHSRYKNGGILFYFTVSKNPTIQIKEIYYEPIFVYVEVGKNVYQYHVLPIRDYLTENTSPQLTKNGRKLMLEFLNDTKEHLEKYSYIERAELVAK